MKQQKLTFRREVAEEVLGAAKLVDTSLVDDRLAEFAAVHEQYVTARAVVVEADRALAEAAEAIDAHETRQFDAVEAIFRSLIGAGRDHNNPFAAYGSPSWYAITRMGRRGAPEAVLKLARAVLRDESIPDAVRAAATEAEQGANAVQEAAQKLEPFEVELREARRLRSHLGKQWEQSLSRLRRAARYAEDEGAVGLYDALFSETRRRSSRKAKSAAEQSTAVVPRDEPSEFAA